MNLKKKNYNNLSKTQVWIINALLNLMNTRPYDKISITKITEEAELARKTFYLNFSSKEEVVLCYIRLMTEDYYSTMKELDEYTPYNLGKLYFDYCQDHLQFINLLQKNKLFILLIDEFEIFLNRISEINKPSDIFKTSSLTKLEEYYFNTFHSAGLWRLLEKWVENGAKETPEQMAGIYEKISIYDVTSHDHKGKIL